MTVAAFIAFALTVAIFIGTSVVVGSRVPRPDGLAREGTDRDCRNTRSLQAPFDDRR